jgi:hypothetical protein
VLRSTAVLLGLVMLGCASQDAAPDQTMPVRRTQALSGTGGSCDDAIVIHAADEESGVLAEQALLLKVFPGFAPVSQSLLFCERRPTDLIRIRTTPDEIVRIYFDISSFYGKHRKR